ncbi:transcription factor HIVEP2a [Neosynchiropus ocellatus]
MEAADAGATRQKEKEMARLQRTWASEPSAVVQRRHFAEQDLAGCSSAGASAPQQNFGVTGNSGKLLTGYTAAGAVGAPGPRDSARSFAQAAPRGYALALGQPYPKHPQTEDKPQPGPEPRAWPFAGQLPSDDLYSARHAPPRGTGRTPRQKSPSLPCSFGQYPQSLPEPEGGRKEQRPKKPGKYICHYCGRACAKPSVLKKHIRSHTGERPYPCDPCGFSFKTKSNLYKHRKSHAHAIKAGLVPFADLAAARAGDADRVSSLGEAEARSDGDQSTDTDEEVPRGPTLPMGEGCPVPPISAGSAEPAYADPAEELVAGSMKVPILIVPKPGGVPAEEGPTFLDMKGSHYRLAAQGGRRGHSLDDSPGAKQRSALKLSDKKSLDGDAPQSLNLLSPHSKGSTDSGYFSRSESAEQPVSPPNTSIKTYEEIMFGRNWYYRPNARARQSVALNLTSSDPGFASVKPPAAFGEMGKIAEGQICLSGEVRISGQPGPGLLEPPSDSGNLVRSNSMPSSSPPVLAVPPGIRGSQSFDEMVFPDDVFYRSGLRRLQRQAAIELSAHESHAGEGSGAGVPDPAALAHHGAKVGVSEIATRKRRIEKSVGDEEDGPGPGGRSCGGSVEMFGDYDYKSSAFDGCRAPPGGKGSLQSAHSQSDSFETCASMCSEDAAPLSDLEGRKAAGNVISVIQHTNSLSRPSSFEKSESLEQPCAPPGALSSQHSEQSDSDVFEDALGPESEGLERHGDGDPVFMSPAAAPQPYHLTHKLVRQPNIQVPEIRVTEEPDKPEKDSEAAASKEPEKPAPPHAEEFQLPQRSDTLAQMPSEKLPPKKKRLRLADMEHSSGDSSFESTCTSLSRSPSQESNLSHSSSFSVSFDREDGLKSVSLPRQDDAAAGGLKASEFLTVPAGGHSGHHQQREMQRSSSEQAPCTLPLELPEMRSKSFDYGSLGTSRQGETYAGTSGKKDRRRGFLVRQASLSVYPEAVVPEPATETSVKLEQVDAGRPGNPGPLHPCDAARRGGKTQPGSGPHLPRFHFLQQSISENGLPDYPLVPQLLQNQLHAPGSFSESRQQAEVFWSLETPRPSQHQVQSAHHRTLGPPCGHQQQIPEPQSRAEAELSPPSQCGSSPALWQDQLPLAARSRSRSGTSVPVRVQTDVPLLGCAMYTSVSQLMAQGEVARPEGSEHDSKSQTQNPGPGAGSSLSRVTATDPQVNTGIPLSLTSGTISITDASGSCPGSSKRVLSPSSSLEQFFQTRQQKRVREERMYGQILKEMSAVELSGGAELEARGLEEPLSCEERMSSSPPAKMPVPVRSSLPPPPGLTRAESFAPPLQIVTDQSSQSCGRSSPEELDVDTVEPDSGALGGVASESPAGVTVLPSGRGAGPGAGGRAVLLTDEAGAQQAFLFPSLRTTSRVSWCFLNYTKPSSCQMGPRSSIYSSWTVSSYDPNPLNLSTKTALAQLRSKQRRNTELLYCTATLSPPGCRKLVSSSDWRPPTDQLKPERTLPGVAGRNVKVVTSWNRAKDERPDKEGPLRPAAPEPARIKIFEGGYKSNEDYVYVRGRGRGKYICEECGIRCKKPSMLKKHIRTHTDVRPYVCRFCNFAFKTKGNLTKHMKSKAHLKKCLELGVSTASVEEADDPGATPPGSAPRRAVGPLTPACSSAADGVDGPRSEMLPHGAAAEHQFSDVDDSEGGEDEGDEVDDEDEEDEDYDGECTPRTHSRSSSPRPLGCPSLSVTAAAASRPHDFLSGPEPPSLFGYFTTVPSIQITSQAPPPDQAGLEPGQGLQGDEDAPLPSPDFSSRLSSPGLDLSGCASPASPASSPSSRRYLSPHRDLSPLQGRLSPRRNLSPLRHVSPKRRDASPRRTHLSLLSPLSRPASPSARDYRRDLSPRGRHKGPMRPLSPRRGFHHSGQQSGGRGLRSASLAGLLGQTDSGYQCHHRTGPAPDRGRLRTSSGEQSPPHRVLFSHLPLHSQLQVRSTLPMIPIGGIQMVHSVPTSSASPRSQQGTPKSGTAACGAESEVEVGGGVSVRREQEENIRSCTWAIASLCIDSEEKGGERASSGPPPPCCPPPAPHGVQHFTERRSPNPGPGEECCKS